MKAIVEPPQNTHRSITSVEATYMFRLNSQPARTRGRTHHSASRVWIWTRRLAAGLVAGVAGAIAILPIVAAYPVVERLWLAPKLRPDLAKDRESTTPA